MPLLKIADLQQPDAPANITRAQQLGQIYYNHIANRQMDNVRYEVDIRGGGSRSAGIHASEISKCHRAVVYSISGTERKPNVQTADLNMLMRFHIGHAVHAMLQNDWKDIAEKSNDTIWFEEEVGINPSLGGAAADWNIHSRCDGCITLCDQAKNPEIRVGVEIKTQSDKQFEKLRAPQPDHVEQATVYMATLDLPLMWLIYYNKSNSNFTSSYAPYLFTFDQYLWENVLEIRFAQLMDMAYKNLLPEGTEGLYCKWCMFAWICQPKILQRRP